MPRRRTFGHFLTASDSVGRWGKVMGKGVRGVGRCKVSVGKCEEACQVSVGERCWVSVLVWEDVSGESEKRCRRVCGLPLHFSTHFSPSCHISTRLPPLPHNLHTHPIHSSTPPTYLPTSPTTSLTPQHTSPFLSHIFSLLPYSQHTWPNSLN